jgi:glycosyltransferase involved in cell wall biosynthesis
VKILQILYYYEPYTSGLTVYAARLARALVARGHEVRILASRHDRSLPATETTPDGIRITRLAVAARFDRAVIMPRLLPEAIRQMRQADVVHLHLPMAEAAALVAAGKLLRKRVVVTHHADLVLARSPLSRLGASVAKWSGIGGARLADALVTNTEGRAAVSPTTRRSGKQATIIPPPVAVRIPGPTAREDFRREHDLGPGPVVGYVGRYASEKGIEVLLQTIPRLRERFPDAIVALAGPRRDPRDGSLLRGPWDAWLERYAEAIRPLDYLSDEDLGRFYAACDVLVLPSTDWTESFGMVQIEAMLCGTPVVASDLPGVREPIDRTGFGMLAAPGDVAALACAILAVLGERERFRVHAGAVDARYSLAATVDAYERVYAAGTGR